MATDQTKHRRFAPGVPALVEERVYAMQFQETILERIGKTLRGHDEGITHEPLPRRWVDLILYLDEQERKRAERRQPRAEPRQRRRE